MSSGPDKPGSLLWEPGGSPVSSLPHTDTWHVKMLGWAELVKIIISTSRVSQNRDAAGSDQDSPVSRIKSEPAAAATSSDGHMRSVLV